MVCFPQRAAFRGRLTLIRIIGQKTCFAFVEFARPDAPDELIEAMVSRPEVPRYGVLPLRSSANVVILEQNVH